MKVNEDAVRGDISSKYSNELEIAEKISNIVIFYH